MLQGNSGPEGRGLPAAGARESEGRWAGQRPAGKRALSKSGQVGLGATWELPKPAQKAATWKGMMGTLQGGGPPWAAPGPAAS